MGEGEWMERGVLRLCLRAYRIRTYVRIRVRGKKAEAEREREIDGKILPLGNVMRGEQMRLTRKNSAAYRMVEEARQNRKDEK